MKILTVCGNGIGSSLMLAMKIEELCKEEGIEPHKSYSGSLNIRISPETHSRIAFLAKQAGISINAFIKAAVEKQIATML